MHPRRLARLAEMGVALGTLACAATASWAGTECGAAGCAPPGWSAGQISGGFGVSGYRPGQTFLPLIGGVLTEVRLGLWSQGPDDAIAEIRPVVGGVPTNAVLAEAVVPGAASNDKQLYVPE